MLSGEPSDMLIMLREDRYLASKLAQLAKYLAKWLAKLGN